MSAKESAALEALARKQRNLKRKILRAEETGNLDRLLTYHAELVKIGQELSRLSVECAVMEKDALPEPPKPVLVLRRSYGLEAFVEGLSAGKKPKDLQSLYADLLDKGLPDLFRHPDWRVGWLFTCFSSLVKLRAFLLSARSFGYLLQLREVVYRNPLKSICFILNDYLVIIHLMSVI